MTIAEKQRSIRFTEGYTQENMTEMLGVSVNTYAQIERGEQDITMGKLEQFAKLTNKTLIEVVAWGERNTVVIEGNALYSAFSQGIVNNHFPDNQEILNSIKSVESRLNKLENEED